MGLLYGRAGRLNTKNGGFRPGQCGSAKLVCKGGGAYDTFSPKFAPVAGDAGDCGPYQTGGCGPSTAPYPKQGDEYSVLHMRKDAGDVAASVSAFGADQLPVKKRVVDEFGTFNRYFVSVPSYSSPNHLFAQVIVPHHETFSTTIQSPYSSTKGWII
jgi:hypothetical protein